MFDSDLLILDEPTTGLDPISLISLKDLLREEQQKGKGIIVQGSGSFKDPRYYDWLKSYMSNKILDDYHLYKAEK